MSRTASPVRRGQLGSAELAEAVMLGDLTLALCVVSRFVPIGGALVVLATIPIAAIASRRRVRAAVVGGMAAASVGFLVAGIDLIITVGACTAIGTLVGFGHRRRWSAARTVAGGILAFWPAASAIALGVLALLPELRRLMLAQVRNSWTGLTNTLRDLGFETAPRVGDHVVTWIIRYWWVMVPAALLLSIALGSFLGWFVARRILGAFDAVVDTHLPVADDPAQIVSAVPVRLDHVSVRYGDRDALALDDVSLDLAAGELVAVVGPNGSGKSTLARVLVGGPATSGTVERAGSAGLGRFGGSAIVFQRPDAQVLGVRVSDDIRWGLPPEHVVDVEVLLARVGLAGFEDRETSTLSGGELQRLAVAAALARGPRLLVSDEATSMLDPAGRRALVARFEDEVARGLCVVHVTHDQHEAAAADRTIRLLAGRRIEGEAPEPVSRRAVQSWRARPGGGLVLRGAGHVYSARTPWAHRALEPIDLEITPGSGVLVAGHNGSGKSTLAWIMAGLLVPSEGRVLLDDRPVDEVVGRVGLSFQHARLQLVERRVAAEVRAAAAVDEEQAAHAMIRVGLDPDVFGTRRVDELSGGEQRRVAIAGMLARDVSVLVLDEPFAGLDTDGREQLVETLLTLREDLGTTLVIVSHDERVADGLTERTIRLERGSVLEDGRPGPRGRSIAE